MSLNSATANNRPSGHQPRTNGVHLTRLGYPITNQHKINQKPKQIHYNNSILFKFDTFVQQFKYDEIINSFVQQIPTNASKSIIAFRPIGSNRKWLVTFDNDFDAADLIDKSFEMGSTTIKFIDPNTDQSVKHAIVRIHWLPPGITNAEINNFIVSRLPNIDHVEINEESYPSMDQNQFGDIKSGVRRIKFQMKRSEEHKLQDLVGKTTVEGHKALITVPGIKMCLNCLGFGHIKSECTAGARCRKCHEFGHLANGCSTANRIMANLNAEKAQLAEDLVTIDECDNNSNQTTQHITHPLPPPPPPPTQTTPTTQNLPTSTPTIERTSVSNKRVLETSPSSNDPASKQAAIDHENDEDYEDLTEENNNDDDDDVTDHNDDDKKNNTKNNDETENDDSTNSPDLSKTSEKTLGKMMEECRKESKKNRQKQKTKEEKNRKKRKKKEIQ
jgi:hypothetical protein